MDYSNSNTDRRTYIDITTSFIDNEMPKVHPAFQSPRFDNQKAQYKPPPAFKVLEQILRDYLKANGQISGKESLDEIIERTSTAESQYDGGSSKMRRAWLWVGDRAQSLENWVELIPDQYGLNILRAGFMVVLGMAEESANKRDCIVDAFRRVADIVKDSEINTASLDWDPTVREAALDLFGAIADLLIELLKLNADGNNKSTNVKNSAVSSRVSKIIKPNKKSLLLGEIDDLLTAMEQKADRLQSYVNSRRDMTIMDIKKLALEDTRQSSQIRYTTKNIEIETRKVSKNVEQTGTKVTHISETVDRTQSEIKEIGQVVYQQSTDIKHMIDIMKKYGEIYRTNTSNMAPEELSWLMDETQQYQDLKSVAERYFAKQARCNMLTLLKDQFKKELASDVQRPNVSLRKSSNSEAFLPLEGFIMLLASKEDPETRDVLSYEVKAVLAQPHKDIKSILSRVQDFDARSQAQTQTIAQKERFLMWMANDEPDILLVNGNLSSSASDNLSAMSLFCATFTISLKTLRPDDVFVHFFCGLHTSSRDWFYGPNGLIRSLIVQLLRALDQGGKPNLDFINSRRYIRRLKAHDLDALCIAVEELITQFPTGTNIYCIIDGVSVLDKDYQGLFEGFKIVLGRLQDIVHGDNLNTNFKILCTTPGRSTRRMKQLINCECHLDLSSNNLNSGSISEYGLRASLSRPPPSSRPRTPNSFYGPERDEYRENGEFKWDYD